MPPDSTSSASGDAMHNAVANLREARLTAKNNPVDRQRLISALESLAELHSTTGDFEKAESHYLEAIQIAEDSRVSGARLAKLCSALGTLYDFNHREDQAVTLYERAIALYEGLNPPQSEAAVELHNNLAMIYKSLGRRPLAEQHYLIALETLENLFGRNHERVAAVYNNLGSLYYTTGHPSQAKDMHREALEIRQSVLGPDHPEVGQSWCNLATTCYALEDDAGTRENYEKGLRIIEQNLPDTAASYEQTMTDYISVLESIGETKKAEVLRKRMRNALKRL
ncbi:MAG: tetratricopeptide repeat protein [Verrucomicrobia bacterium]|nr:tetratricopeptide repeat protein [Verrucomicrobiota bacterium]